MIQIVSYMPSIDFVSKFYFSHECFCSYTFCFRQCQVVFLEPIDNLLSSSFIYRNILELVSLFLQILHKYHFYSNDCMHIMLYFNLFEPRLLDGLNQAMYSCMILFLNIVYHVGSHHQVCIGRSSLLDDSFLSAYSLFCKTFFTYTLQVGDTVYFKLCSLYYFINSVPGVPSKCLTYRNNVLQIKIMFVVIIPHLFTSVELHLKLLLFNPFYLLRFSFVTLSSVVISLCGSLANGFVVQVAQPFLLTFFSVFYVIYCFTERYYCGLTPFLDIIYLLASP